LFGCAALRSGFHHILERRQPVLTSEFSEFLDGGQFDGVIVRPKLDQLRGLLHRILHPPDLLLRSRRFEPRDRFRPACADQISCSGPPRIRLFTSQIGMVFQ
jgi:hypothetical protein